MSLSDHGSTEIVLCDSYQDLGRIAARYVAATLRKLFDCQSEVRIIVSAAESQATVLSLFVVEVDLDWGRVVCVNSDQQYYPMELGLAKFANQFSVDFGITSAAAVVAMLPTLIAFVYLRRHIVDGVTLTGVKG